MSASTALLTRIVVRIQVGKDRMAGSDDPLFLGLEGPQGREFRLAPARGQSLRRGGEDVFVLSDPDDPDTNVEFPALNDPGAAAIDWASITGVYLRKGFEPIPNVRGLGEMDDRVQIQAADVELYAQGAPKPRRFARSRPVWLGLVCGTRANLTPADEA